MEKVLENIDNKRVIYIGEKVERIEIQDHDKDSNLKVIGIYNSDLWFTYNIKTKELCHMFITQADLDLAKSINESLPEWEEKVKAVPTKKVIHDIFYGDVSKPKSILPVIEKYVEAQIGEAK